MIKNEILLEDINNILEYQNVKDYLFMQVINAKENKELLDTVPNTVVGDLAITYHIMIQTTDSKYCSAKVTNALMYKYGIDVNQLHRDAEISSPKMMVPEVGTIETLIFGSPKKEIEKKEMELFILTNEHRTDGAATIFYPNVLKELSQNLGYDLYIIPSSTDECLAICDSPFVSSAYIQNVLKDVNENVVSKNDKLSDTLYHYSKDEHRLEKAEDFQKRIQKKVFSQTLS